jgi:hypothetical protein
MTPAYLILGDQCSPETAAALSAWAQGFHWCEKEKRLVVYASDVSNAESVRSALDAGEIFRLDPLMHIDGASAGERPAWHYIVWTDVTPGWEEELNEWYEKQHLPGLAGVPGAVRARRYRHEGNGPRWFACYDLLSPQTPESEPWLKVRATEWSSRMRPHFTNTHRWMCKTLYGDKT